ncbi:MAG: hypothetical protein OHK006_24980 [Thermodesulfovibrionales bacterium]
MILHPGILALLVGAALSVLMASYAALLGMRILKGWDFSSSSASQLQLERRTYLVSSLMSAALSFEAVSVLLFLYTVEDIHRLFVGAMCATGTLNANPVGWYALGLKVLIFFLALIWITMNRFDQRAGDFPLLRLKYAALLVVAPLLALDLFLQARFFLGLEPEIITSCCGSLFSSEGGGVAAEISGLPVRMTMTAFFALTAVTAAAAASALFSGSRTLRIFLSALSAAWFCISLVSVVSFISLYVYELPTHHCPFDIIQKEYRFIGYPLYVSLFAAAGFGMLPGLFVPARRIPSLLPMIMSAERSWILVCILCIIAFTGIVLWYMLSGTFTLEGYL